MKPASGAARAPRGRYTAGAMKLPSILGPAVLLLALGACSNDTVEKVKRMADRACECRDAACADKVEKEFWDFAKGGQKQGSQSERDDVQEQYARMRECIVKIRSAAGTPPSGAEKGAPAAPQPEGGK